MVTARIILLGQVKLEGNKNHIFIGWDVECGPMLMCNAHFSSLYDLLIIFFIHDANVPTKPFVQDRSRLPDVDELFVASVGTSISTLNNLSLKAPKGQDKKKRRNMPITCNVRCEKIDCRGDLEGLIFVPLKFTMTS